ncbi:MAG: AAA family ATPase [Coriobacteriia bacterium]
MYERTQTGVLARRLAEPRRFIQILFGPRQVGKTTSLKQAVTLAGFPVHYATADVSLPQPAGWLQDQWAIARAMVLAGDAPVILAIDEVQKVPDWSALVKWLWDEDSFADRDIRVVLTGSAPVLLQRALSTREFVDVRTDPAAWGRLVEAAVGAHLLGRSRLDRTSVGYWRTRVGGRDLEVDYVVAGGSTVEAIEVKSVLATGAHEGLTAFRAGFGEDVVTRLIGPGGTPLEQFLSE